MDYSIKTIPHEDEKYDTAGNYWFEDGKTQIRVSNLGNEDYEFLVIVHELIEEHLTRKRGIPESVITEWDINHIDHSDPGSIEGCPYFAEHAFATYIEKHICSKFGIDWNEYDASFSQLKWRNNA
jgi:hypothetical protein